MVISLHIFLENQLNDHEKDAKQSQRVGKKFHKETQNDHKMTPETYETTRDNIYQKKKSKTITVLSLLDSVSCCYVGGVYACLQPRGPLSQNPSLHVKHYNNTSRSFRPPQHFTCVFVSRQLDYFADNLFFRQSRKFVHFGREKKCFQRACWISSHI